MHPIMTPRHGQRGPVSQSATVRPGKVQTTLYDVMAALQSVTEPTEDAVVIAVMMHWLRSGRLTRQSQATVAA
jgi:hypothetical protein